jgi:hypothetical protein
MSNQLMKPNRYDKACSELEKIGIEGVSVPSEIKVADRHHNLVMIVESTPNPKTMKFDHKARFQAFNDASYELFKNGAQNHPDHKVFLYHSASVQVSIEKKEAEKAAKEEAEKAAKAAAKTE